MDGRDFRALCSDIMANDPILFQDADGKFHEIYTAYRVHTRGGARVVLMEGGALAKEFPAKLDTPPQNLTDYLNRLWSKVK